MIAGRALRHLLLACVCLGLLLGCGGGGGAKKLRIAVIPKGTTHEFWKSVHAGAEQAAQELGDVEILWKGPLSEGDRDGQITVVQDFVTRRVDGIVLAPLDSQALVPAVQEAWEFKVPVVIFDSGLDAEAKYVASYVATDNRKGGALAAKRLVEAMGGKGNVVLFRYNVGSDSTHQREEGFLEELQNHPDVKILSSDQYAGVTPEGAASVATTVLGKVKDEVNGVFAVCEPNATGVLKALEDLEIRGKVKFVAFDPATPLVEGLKSGAVHGIVLQDPVKMGYEGVQAAVRKIRGEPVEARIGTGEHVATPENMTTPEMDKLLHPVRFGEK